jgi:hypothetical protein
MVFLLPDAEINNIVSHLPGVVASVRAKAHEGVDHGAVDAFVSLDDERGDHAAAAIEYGRSGGRGGATQGVHALSRAF